MGEGGGVGDLGKRMVELVHQDGIWQIGSIELDDTFVGACGSEIMYVIRYTVPL